jgi:hypothetical protein
VNVRAGPSRVKMSCSRTFRPIRTSMLGRDCASSVTNICGSTKNGSDWGEGKRLRLTSNTFAFTGPIAVWVCAVPAGDSPSALATPALMAVQSDPVSITARTSTGRGTACPRAIRS